jgi:putative ABC transport system ATP-binding protein/lipoprotein-releasing system ATP-binding protein
VHLRDGRLSTRTAAEAAAASKTEIDGKAETTAGTKPTALKTPGSPLIEARDLCRTFDLGADPVHAVKNASLVLHQGARIAVTGPSGSGKSTLLKMLAGLEPPTSGSLTWFGATRAEMLRPRRVGVVFQEPSLIPSLTVRENVGLPLQIASDFTDRPHMTADQALDMLSLSDLADKLPDELSGGQMQRVAFARALVTNPEIILADEPTGQLDQPTGHAVLQTVLQALEKNETALLLTTHDQKLASTMATQFRMDHGLLAVAT